MYTTQQIKDLINANRTDKFYNDRYWRKLAGDIKQEQNNECQHCKSKGQVFTC